MAQADDRKIEEQEALSGKLAIPSTLPAEREGLVSLLRELNKARPDKEGSWLSDVFYKQLTNRNRAYSLLSEKLDIKSITEVFSPIRQEFYKAFSTRYSRGQSTENVRYAILASMLPEESILAGLVACTNRSVESALDLLSVAEKSRGYILIDASYFDVGEDQEAFLKGLLADLEAMYRDPEVSVQMIGEIPEDIPVKTRTELETIFQFFKEKSEFWDKPDKDNSVMLLSKKVFEEINEQAIHRKTVKLVFETNKSTGLSMVRQALPIARGILAEGGIEAIREHQNPELERAIRSLYAAAYAEAWGRELEEAVPLEEILLNPSQFLIPPVSKSDLHRIDGMIESLKAFDKAA